MVDDPFDALRLDEDLVRRADVREPTAVGRAADARWSAAPSSPPPHPSRHRRRPRNGLAVAVAVAAISLVAMGRDGAGGVLGLPTRTLGLSDIDHPPPSDEQAANPLGRPALPPASGGPHRFLQGSEDDPVAYDPCRPVHVVVNNRTAPFGWEPLLDAGLAEITRVTGLRFVVDGPTAERPSAERSPYQPSRYPGRWAPVLVAWSDPGEYPDLAGDVVGVGGSIALDTGSDEVYVTGLVALDGPDLAGAIESGRGMEQALAVFLHELGHLVGLDHVDDPSQLMAGEGHPGITRYQAGDLQGLAALGQGRCFPDV